MTESALETSPVAAPVPTDHTGIVAHDPSGVTPLPTGDFAPAAEPAEPELTEEQKNEKAFYEALDAWQKRFDPEWEHERIEFHGDYLAIYVPSPGALTAVSLGSGKYVGDQTRTDLVGKFMLLHLGPESYGQYMTRMMNPAEKDYGDNAFGDFITRLGEMAAAAAEASTDLD